MSQNSACRCGKVAPFAAAVLFLVGRFSPRDIEPAETFVCCAVVVVLSPECVRKPYPMAELRTLLQRKDEKGSCRLLPVLYGITYEQCMGLRTNYVNDKWWRLEDKPAADELERWASMVERLLCVTAKHEAQVQMKACSLVSLHLYILRHVTVRIQVTEHR